MKLQSSRMIAPLKRRQIFGIAAVLAAFLLVEFMVGEHGKAPDLLPNDTPIDLLFCDVVLGGPIDGVKLAEFARDLRPGLKVLLTSGYPDQVQARSSGMPIIAKPYQQADLAAQLASLFPYEIAPA